MKDSGNHVANGLYMHLRDVQKEQRDKIRQRVMRYRCRTSSDRLGQLTFLHLLDQIDAEEADEAAEN